MNDITDFMTETPQIVKEFPERLGDPGDIIPIYKIESDRIRIRDYFAKILKIVREDGVFLHYLERLPELSHEEKMRRARK